MCVTFYYSIKSDGSDYFADNEQIFSESTNGDPHDIVLESLGLKTGGYGAPCIGTTFLSGFETWSVSSPNSGTTYYETPSWAGSYYRLNSSGGDTQSATATLHWTYHGSAEVLAMTYTLPDSGRDGPRAGALTNALETDLNWRLNVQSSL